MQVYAPLRVQIQHRNAWGTLDQLKIERTGRAAPTNETNDEKEADRWNKHNALFDSIVRVAVR